MPGYLPEGFTVKRANYENGDTERWYSDGNGRTVFFGAYTIGSGISGIDNEHADYTVVVPRHDKIGASDRLKLDETDGKAARTNQDDTDSPPMRRVNTRTTRITGE
jgi:hypothetical protein